MLKPHFDVVYWTGWVSLNSVGLKWFVKKFQCVLKWHHFFNHVLNISASFTEFMFVFTWWRNSCITRQKGSLEVKFSAAEDLQSTEYLQCCVESSWITVKWSGVTLYMNNSHLFRIKSLQTSHFTVRCSQAHAS